MAQPGTTAPHCVDQLKEAIGILPTQPEEGLHARQLKAGIRILDLCQLEQRVGLKHSNICARLSPGNKQFNPKFPLPISLAAESGPTCRRPAAVVWI
ncbi:hypothetical protein D9M72_323880 [compost metagenome]